MAARPDPHDRPPADQRSRAPLHSAPPAPPVPEARPGSRPAEPAHEPLAPVGRHCWVYPPRESSRTPHAGLLIEWRRTGAGYEGLVVYLADLASGRRLTQLQEWVPAEHLRPRS